MEEPESAGPRAWTIRRAELRDVPAVVRLLKVPPTNRGTESATRLILAHIGLDLGEFWVAAGADGHPLAAVVLLPFGDGGQERLQVAFRLELGLPLPSIPGPVNATSPAQPHWLLLPAMSPGGEPMLAELLAAAMPAVDATGLPVLSLQHGPPSQVLTEVGFEQLSQAPIVV